MSTIRKRMNPDIRYPLEHACHEVEGHGHDGSRQTECQQTAIRERVADERRDAVTAHDAVETHQTACQLPEWDS